jgi:hypothetical protein
VDARFLLAAFDATYLIALTAWVGSLLFFTFGVAPILFQVLDAAAAARFVRALFPRYYAWGATWGGVALAALVCGTLTHPELRGPWVAVQAGLILAGTLTMLYGGNTLTPAINAARDAGPPAQDRFDRLHRLGVRLNGFVLVAGLTLLVAFAARPSPRSGGLGELPPEQLRQYVARERENQDTYQATISRMMHDRGHPAAPASGLRTP